MMMVTMLMTMVMVMMLTNWKEKAGSKKAGCAESALNISPTVGALVPSSSWSWSWWGWRSSWWQWSWWLHTLQLFCILQSGWLDIYHTIHTTRPWEAFDYLFLWKGSKYFLSENNYFYNLQTWVPLISQRQCSSKMSRPCQSSVDDDDGGNHDSVS